MTAEKGREKKPSWKDYIAIIIAMFATTLLPLVIFLVILLVVTFLAALSM